jgi:hypothetical protein
MLAGYAVEAFAKAVHVKQNPKLLAKGKWQLKTHALVPLVSDVGLTLTPREHSTLVEYSGFVQWSGRYPIPIEAASMTPIVKPGAEGGLDEFHVPPGTVLRSDDLDVIDGVCARLERLLDKEAS